MRQRTLFKKKEIIHRKITKSKYSTLFGCIKHSIFFWRNLKEKTGTCGFCFDETRSRILNHNHILAIDLTIEQREKMNIDMEGRMMWGGGNVKVEEAIKVEDGKYEGTIIEVEERTEPYEYTDFVVLYKVEDKEVKLKYGCPSNITIDPETGEGTSKLAKTLTTFGFEMKKEDEITNAQIKEHFKGLKVSSLISNEKSKKDGKMYVTVMTMTPKK